MGNGGGPCYQMMSRCSPRPDTGTPSTSGGLELRKRSARVLEQDVDVDE